MRFTPCLSIIEQPVRIDQLEQRRHLEWANRTIIIVPIIIIIIYICALARAKTFGICPERRPVIADEEASDRVTTCGAVDCVVVVCVSSTISRQELEMDKKKWKQYYRMFVVNRFGSRKDLPRESTEQPTNSNMLPDCEIVRLWDYEAMINNCHNAYVTESSGH